MRIRFVCECGKKLVTTEKNAGRSVRCPACGQQLRVPQQVSSVQPPVDQAEKPASSTEELDEVKPRASRRHRIRRFVRLGAVALFLVSLTLCLVIPPGPGLAIVVLVTFVSLLVVLLCLGPAWLLRLIAAVFFLALAGLSLVVATGQWGAIAVTVLFLGISYALLMEAATKSRRLSHAREKATATLIGATLDTGEEALAVCGFYLPGALGTLKTLTAAVTTNKLRTFGFQCDWLGKPVRILRTVTFRLDAISDISSSRRKAPLTRARFLELIFWCDGKQETLWTKCAQGEDFIAKLKEMIAVQQALVKDDTAMPIQLRCPNCGRAFSVPQGHAGRETRCSACQMEFRVPAPEEPKLPAQIPASHPPPPEGSSPPPLLKRREAAPLSAAPATDLRPDSGSEEVIGGTEQKLGFFGKLKAWADKAGRQHQVIFIGGPYDLRPKTVGVLTLDDDELVYTAGIISKREVFRLSYSAIAGASVDTAESLGKLRTLGTWALAGPLAAVFVGFGLKKKQKFLKLDFRDDTDMQVAVILGKGTGTDIDALCGRILEFRHAYLLRHAYLQRVGVPQSTSGTATQEDDKEDLTAIIERLAHLHAKGILTDEEFQKKKADLLSRL